MITISQAKISDHKIIVDIGRVAVEAAHRDSCSTEDMSKYIDRNYSEEAIIAELSDSKNIYHIITYNDEAIGFSKIILNQRHKNITVNNAAKLDRIYLSKAYQDRNFGQTLMNFLIDYCKDKGQTGIWLFTWTENLKALKFYKKNDFKIIGSDQFQVTETLYNPLHHMLLTFKS